MGQLRGLIVDYGGVLTTALDDTMTAWMSADGVDPVQFAALMRRWLAPEAHVNPVHELETGRLPVPEFERLLAAELRRPDGAELEATGMVARMLAGFRPAAPMTRVVAQAKAAGIRTALLSNSWGLDYPREGWPTLFDVVVISGEVGMRKPEERIYRHTAELIGLNAEECVFVDDLAHNVRGAVAAGMVGVHHTDARTTTGELEALFGRQFA
ncbi:MAG: HAD family phosphatase [Actinomycetota bacterium]|nr:HAD family phosphatase [Actinomycetota bacterium]